MTSDLLFATHSLRSLVSLPLSSHLRSFSPSLRCPPRRMILSPQDVHMTIILFFPRDLGTFVKPRFFSSCFLCFLTPPPPHTHTHTHTITQIHNYTSGIIARSRFSPPPPPPPHTHTHTTTPLFGTVASFRIFSFIPCVLLFFFSYVYAFSPSALYGLGPPFFFSWSPFF
jgi:hypothetical protein